MAWPFWRVAPRRLKSAAGYLMPMTIRRVGISKDSERHCDWLLVSAQRQSTAWAKIDYKLAWFERLIRHAATLCYSGRPVVLTGDYNVVPTDFDIYDPRSWLKDALLQPETRECYQRLLSQGWTDALRARFPDQRVYTFWDYFRHTGKKIPGCGSNHLLLNPLLNSQLVEAGVDTWCEPSRRQ